YERPYIVLDVFGSDGLLVRMDLFDVDREAEALARFDELVTTPQAAPSENAATRLLVAGGLITRMEVFEPEDVDAALARFAERRAIPPKAATRAADRYVEALVARDWEAVEATCAPSLVFEDRRRLVRITGDRDMFIANSKLLGAAEQRVARTVLATAGERLALRRHHWTTQGGLLAFGMDVAARDEPKVETECLVVSEVDTEGRSVAVILFDADDRRAASAEMLERYARSDGARCIPAGLFELIRAIN